MNPTRHMRSETRTYGAVVETANTSGFHPEDSRFDPVQHHQAHSMVNYGAGRFDCLFRSTLAEKTDYILRKPPRIK